MERATPSALRFQKMDPPSDYPCPIVYGPDFPQFKMLMRHGRQVFESRTNQNLFLDEQPWSDDFDSSGTFTMAGFLARICSWKERAALLFDGIFGDEGSTTFDWLGIRDEPDWDGCPPCADLINYCDSDAQRSFLRSWWRTQYARGLEEAWRQWTNWLGRVAEARRHELLDPVAARGRTAFVQALTNLVFSFPALVPEVWLNYVGPEKTVEDEEHLRENPQRVDFVMIAAGKKCVIEIDGPSHYADYDRESRRYSINENLYAKNLKIERSLRRQGWQIHRFANVEVKDVPDDEFVELVRHLPGAADDIFGFPFILGRELKEAMGDADRYLIPS